MRSLQTPFPSLQPSWNELYQPADTSTCTAAQQYSRAARCNRHVGPDVRNQLDIRNCFITQCSMLVTNPNLKNPKSLQWNLDLQRAITNNLTLDVAYVGVHGYDEIHSVDLNEPAFGTGWDSTALSGERPPAWGLTLQCQPSAQAALSQPVAAADTTAEAAARPYATEFPYFQYIAQTTNGFHSNYDGLQVTLNSPELPRPELPGRLYLQPRSRRLDKELAGHVGAGKPGQPAISVRKQRHGCPASLAVFADLYDPWDQDAGADAGRLADQRDLGLADRLCLGPERCHDRRLGRQR